MHREYVNIRILLEDFSFLNFSSEFATTIQFFWKHFTLRVSELGLLVLAKFFTKNCGETKLKRIVIYVCRHITIKLKFKFSWWQFWVCFDCRSIEQSSSNLLRILLLDLSSSFVPLCIRTKIIYYFFICFCCFHVFIVKLKIKNITTHFQKIKYIV